MTRRSPAGGAAPAHPGPTCSPGKDLERRELSGSTIRRKLAACSSLFEYCSEANTITHNPVEGGKRPKVEGHEGQTPVISDAQARQLLKLPADTPKVLRERTLLSLLLHHGLRREELAQLTLGDPRITSGAA